MHDHLHRGGKLVVASTVPLTSREDLSLAYTPGVARVCEAIAADPTEEWGLNALCLSPGRALMAAEAPRSAERLAARGVEVIPVEYGELHKNGGGVHCSTMELVREPAS